MADQKKWTWWLLEFRKSGISEVGILGVTDMEVKLPLMVIEEVMDWKLVHMWVSHRHSQDCGKIEKQVI